MIVMKCERIRPYCESATVFFPVNLSRRQLYGAPSGSVLEPLCPFPPSGSCPTIFAESVLSDSRRALVLLLLGIRSENRSQ